MRPLRSRSDEETTVAPEAQTAVTRATADRPVSAGVRKDGGTHPADQVDGVAAPLVEDELLVEEVSIDGMCGVY